MFAAFVAPFLLIAAEASVFQPDEIAAMRRFEGQWGFVRSQPEDSNWGDGFRGGLGDCGGPKALRLDVRLESLPNQPQEWRLRLHPDQPFGALVTRVETRGARDRLAVQVVGNVDFFEREGDALSIRRGNVQLDFKRCPTTNGSPTGD